MKDSSTFALSPYSLLPKPELQPTIKQEDSVVSECDPADIAEENYVTCLNISRDGLISLLLRDGSLLLYSVRVEQKKEKLQLVASTLPSIPSPPFPSSHPPSTAYSIPSPLGVSSPLPLGVSSPSGSSSLSSSLNGPPTPLPTSPLPKSPDPTQNPKKRKFSDIGIPVHSENVSRQPGPISYCLS